MAERAAQGRHQGYAPVAPRVIVEGSRVNIIQHPDGRPRKVVLTQNYVVSATNTRIQCVADTMPGSSGAPVFNTRWELIGLHHSGKPYPSDGSAGDRSSWKRRYRVNEGIPIRQSSRT
jgi:V8-like Glu-specific endopeptidase